MCPLNSEIETLPSVSKLSCKEQSMKLQQEGREGTSCGLSQHGAAHSIPCCQGAVWVGSLLRSLEVQLVINSITMCFMRKASLPWGGSRLSGEKHGGISGCGGLPLCSWWASAPCRAAAPSSPGLAPHQPRSSGQRHNPVDMSTNGFISLSPALEKVKRLHKISVLQHESGGSPGRTSQWHVGKRGNVLRKEHLTVFL